MSIENYSLQKPGGIVDRLATRKRKIMFDLFARSFPEELFEQVLDVGVTADRASLSSNYLEKYLSDKTKIIALSNQNAAFLEEIYPGLKFKMGDAKNLPFPDNSVDVIFSSAVIEHIGGQELQKQMISECFRTAKKGVFITTPNRWHPVEVHTLLPFIHYLPKKMHRYILNFLKFHFYAKEENLNLLDKRSLSEMCKSLGINHFKIHTISTMGFASNLILIIKKLPSRAPQEGHRCS